MNKLLKVAMWAVGGLLAIIIAAIIIVPLVVDPNDYKGLITEQVKQATGRDLTLEGDLDLSVFPWLGIKTGAVKLSQPKGFGDKPMLEIGQAQLKAKLLPLLSKNLEIDTIVIKDITARLMVNKSGVSNWQDLTSSSSSTSEPTEESPDSSVPAIEIEGIKIAGGNLTLEDKQLGTKHILSDLAVKSGKVFGSQAPFHAEFNLTDGGASRSVSVSLDSKMGIDLKKQTLALDDLRLEIGPMELKGSVEGVAILDKPSFKGNLNADNFNLRELLSRLGVEVDTADDKAMTQVGFTSQFTATDDSIALSDLSARLDDSEVNGQISIASFAKSSYRFDLNLNEIDVDRYLASVTDSSEAQATTGEPGMLFALPLDAFKGLNANGKFSIGKIKASGLAMTDIEIAVKSSNGKVSINPINAKLYGGALKGNMVYAQSGNNARLTIKENMTNIDLGQLLADANVIDSLEGRGDLSLNANVSEQSGKQNQQATASINVRDGALKGIDLGKIIRQARNIRDKISGKQSDGKSATTERTEFSELFGTFKLNNNLVQNTDLTLKAPLFRVGGRGSADLAKETLDYKLAVKVVGTSEGQGGASQDKLVGVTIPVKLYGALSAPGYSIDIAALLRTNVKEKTKQKAKEKLKEKLGGKLRGLF